MVTGGKVVPPESAAQRRARLLEQNAHHEHYCQDYLYVGEHPRYCHYLLGYHSGFAGATGPHKNKKPPLIRINPGREAFLQFACGYCIDGRKRFSTERRGKGLSIEKDLLGFLAVFLSRTAVQVLSVQLS